MFGKCAYYKQAFYKTKALVALSVFSKYCEYRCRLVSQFENSGVSAWCLTTQYHYLGTDWTELAPVQRPSEGWAFYTLYTYVKI